MAIRRLETISELATRENNGIEVTLLWNRRTDELQVRVSDSCSGVWFELSAESDNALDVFYHPYFYATLSRRPSVPSRVAA